LFREPHHITPYNNLNSVNFSLVEQLIKSADQIGYLYTYIRLLAVFPRLLDSLSCIHLIRIMSAINSSCDFTCFEYARWQCCHGGL